MRIEKGERVLLRGVSGVGKSTFIRALAGLWPHYSGKIYTPEGVRFFIPQKAYIPTGSLVRALTYPLDSSVVDFERAQEALHDAGLETLSSHLSSVEVWSSKLSGGEVQRLALARIILQRPDWLFLDEATSSLDPDAETFFYKTIVERLPNVSLISIAHREQVEGFHSRVVEFKDRGA